MAWAQKLHLGFLTTLWASRVIPAGAKGLWEKHLYLDQGPDGCHMRSDEMAQLMGGSTATVETYRQRLCELGLLRKGETGMRRHWFVDYPADVKPPLLQRGRKTPTSEIVAAAARLDAILLERGGWPKTGAASGNRNPPNPDPNPGLFDASAPVSADETRTGVRVGGSGGSSINHHPDTTHLSGNAEDRRSDLKNGTTDRRGAREPQRIGELITDREKTRRGFLKAAAEARSA